MLHVLFRFGDIFGDDNRSEDGRLSVVGGSSLRISPVKGYDAALYTCRAFNLEDSIDGDATLTVQGAPLVYLRSSLKPTQWRHWGREADRPPGDTIQEGDTRMKAKFCG